MDVFCIVNEERNRRGFPLLDIYIIKYLTGPITHHTNISSTILRTLVASTSKKGPHHP
jgi:phosphopantetheine adenylyltransferase